MYHIIYKYLIHIIYIIYILYFIYIDIYIYLLIQPLGDLNFLRPLGDMMLHIILARKKIILGMCYSFCMSTYYELFYHNLLFENKHF